MTYKPTKADIKREHQMREIMRLFQSTPSIKAKRRLARKHLELKAQRPEGFGVPRPKAGA